MRCGEVGEPKVGAHGVKRRNKSCLPQPHGNIYNDLHLHN